MMVWRLFRYGISFIIIIDVFLWLYDPLSNEKILNNIYTSATNQIGGDFTLIDQNGLERSTSEFRGKYVLVYFGYTLCDGICYRTLEDISHALKILDHDLDMIVPIFVTINPERDTAANLKIYAKNFHPKFILMTGTTEKIAAVLKKYKVYHLRKPDETMVGPLIEHSNLVYLLDRDGLLVRFFDQKLSPKELANEIKSIMNKE